MRTRTIAPLLVLISTSCPQPTPPPPEPNPAPEPRFGERARVLSWTSEEKRVGFGNMDRVFPTRTVSHTSSTPQPVYPLPVALRDLSQVSVDGNSIADYRERFKVAGMLVIKQGSIVYEHYAFGHTREKRWTLWSVAKSVVSMLVGAAIQDGYIRGLDARVTDYLPNLKGRAYDGVTIGQLMTMSSGVAWNERYDDPNSDVSRMGSFRAQGEPALFRFLGDRPRAAEPGTRFNYNTGETHLVGSVVRAAVGNNLSDYLSRKIWSRFAMESDASWMIDEKSGSENGGCCLNATLRDYGRIGLFALRRGKLSDGTAIVPEGYLDQTTSPSAAYAGYGRLWWLHDVSYGARGIFGQHIHIYPADDLVIVTNAFADNAIASFDYSVRRRTHSASRGVVAGRLSVRRARR